MIWDAFIFNNELDLLDLRLNVHAPFVDRFVLVESLYTFRGNPKPLYYFDNKARFKDFNKRIIHVVAGGEDWKGRNPWLNEAEQRNAIHHGLIEAEPDDLLCVCDVDEMIDFQSMNIRDSNPYKIQMHNFMYYLNLKHVGEIWKSANVFPMIGVQKYGADFHALRHCDIQRTREVCGWHFTYMGGPVYVKHKLQSFSHSEFDTPHYTKLDAIEQRISKQMNVTGDCQELSLSKIPIAPETHPKFLVENQERYKHLILC